MYVIRSNRRVLAGAVSILCLCATVAACGGGGGSAPPPPPIPIALGVHSATQPSTVGRSFLNPLGSPAVVSAPPATGPFHFGTTNLGTQVAGGGTVSLDLVFEPEGPGPASDVLTLRWTAAGASVDQRFEVSAEGEEILWTVTPDPVDFGDVLPGETLELDVRVRNGSQRSPVTFTQGTLPPGVFNFVGTPFPQTIQPGLEGTFRVRFAPEVVSSPGGVMRLGPNDVGGPLDIPLWANASGSGEQVVDFGSQTLDTFGVTDVLTLDVPDTAVSITFEGAMSGSAEVGLKLLEGPGGRVYENASGTGPVLWTKQRDVFSLHLPSSDDVSTQLVAGGGTYRFQLYRVSGSGTSMDVRAIVERRANGTNLTALLPLNVYLANGIAPSAATAAGDTKLQAALARMDQILQTRGVRLGEITYYDIADGSFDFVAQGEEQQLFQASGSAARTRLNLFFVRSVWAGQLLGISGAIDGARVNGRLVSGVAIQYDGMSGDTVGVIACHEACHYLGLWHTTEANGAHDPINDTPECPVTGTDAVCSIPGGGQLMHWQGLGGTILSAGQGQVLRGHAHMRAPGQTGQLRLKPRPITPLPPEAVVELDNLPAGWCGCCREP